MSIFDLLHDYTEATGWQTLDGIEKQVDPFFYGQIAFIPMHSHFEAGKCEYLPVCLGYGKSVSPRLKDQASVTVLDKDLVDRLVASRAPEYECFVIPFQDGKGRPIKFCIYDDPKTRPNLFD